MQARHLTVHYPPEQSWSRMEVESPKWEDVAPANGGTNEISVPVGFMKQGPVALLTAEMLFEDRRYQARRGGSRTDAGPRDPAVRQGRLPRRSELCRPRAISCATISSCTIARAASSCRPRMGSWKETRLPARQMHALFLTTFPPEGPGAQNVTIAGNSISGGGVNGGLGAVVLSRERNVYGQPAHNPPVHQNLILMDNRINCRAPLSTFRPPTTWSCTGARCGTPIC
jgi:hypothetical protein